MDVDHKSLGSLSSAPNLKKRQIAFRLNYPSKRAKLQHQQRIAAPKYTSFLLERTQSATPDTPSSSTTNLDEDPFYDSDTELASPSGPYDAEKHYQYMLDHEKSPRHGLLAESALPSATFSMDGEKSARDSPDAEKSQQTWDEYVKERLKKSYQQVSANNIFKDQPFWTALLEAKLNPPSDSRFTPKLLKAVGDKLETSMVINLYATYFSFDDSEQTYPYHRNYNWLLDAINYGILTAQVQHFLPRQLTTTQPDGTTKPANFHFYDGYIVAEIRDFREGRAFINPATQTMQPHVSRVFLRPDYHGVLGYVDSQQLLPRQRMLVEQALVEQLYPELHLNPDPETTKYLWAIHSSFQRPNVPSRQKVVRRRNALMPLRSIHTLPSVLQYDDGESAIEKAADEETAALPLVATASLTPAPGTDSASMDISEPALAEPKSIQLVALPQVPTSVRAAVAQEPSKLFKHLQAINFSPTFHKEPDTAPTQPEKKKPYQAKPDPTLKEAVLPHPQVVGHFAFTLQHRLPPNYPPTAQPPLDYLTLEINNRSAGSTQPFEMMHTSLRYGNGKALHFQPGGPAATARFLNQFKKVEHPASAEQIKQWQSPQQPARVPIAPGAAPPPQQQGPGPAQPHPPQPHPPTAMPPQPSPVQHPSAPSAATPAHPPPAAHHPGPGPANVPHHMPQQPEAQQMPPQPTQPVAHPHPAHPPQPHGPPQHAAMSHGPMPGPSTAAHPPTVAHPPPRTTPPAHPVPGAPGAPQPTGARPMPAGMPGAHLIHPQGTPGAQTAPRVKQVGAVQPGTTVPMYPPPAAGVKGAIPPTSMSPGPGGVPRPAGPGMVKGAPGTPQPGAVPAAKYTTPVARPPMTANTKFSVTPPTGHPQAPSPVPVARAPVKTTAASPSVSASPSPAPPAAASPAPSPSPSRRTTKKK